jgi:hypothetical protein
MVHARPRHVAVYVGESEFGTEDGGPDDWSTNATYCYVTGVDTSGLVEQVVANENNITHPRQKHDNIHTLRSGVTIPFGLYLHGNPTHAAEAGTATTYHIAQLAYAALGGRYLGKSAAVVTSGDEETNEIEIGANPGFVIGDFVYYYHAATGIGQLYRILAIADGPPITLTVDRPVHIAVEDRAEADTLRAVIDIYIHAYACTQKAHSDHKTIAMLVEGDATGDVNIARGGKPQMTIDPISAGKPLQLKFEAKFATFVRADEATAEDFGAATPVGERPLVPGRGDHQHLVLLADVGSPLASVEQRGAINMNPGVVYEPIEGVNSIQGVHGWIDKGLADTTVQIMLPFGTDYHTEYDTHVHKHMLIQIGTGTDCVGFYFPELEYAKEPPRNEEQSVTGVSIDFRAHLNSASFGALTGNNKEKWLSGFHMLLLS